MKSKKADLQWDTTIGLIIIVLLIPISYIFITNILTLLTNKPEQSTLNSFESVEMAIKKLTGEIKEEEKVEVAGQEVEVKEEKGESFIVIPYFIQDDYGLVGFSKDRDKIEQECGFPDVTLTKPPICLRTPCLCLSKVGWGISDVENYVKCSSFNNVRNFYSEKDSLLNLGKPHPPTNSVNTNYNNLAIWSECGNQDSFRVKNIKITRLKTDKDKVYDLVFNVLPQETS